MSREQIRLDVEELARDGGLLDQLEALLPEPVSDPTVGSAQHHKVSGSPAPWHNEAADVFLTIHAGARELERDLRYRVTGRLAHQRGGSDLNTKQALHAVTALVEAVDDIVTQDAAAQVASWCRMARQVRDIDQQDRFEPLPRVKGWLPPSCPYCDVLSLRWSRQRGIVICINHDCLDGEDRRPRASMEIGEYSGQGMLVFRDGYQVHYRMEEAS